MLKDSEQQDEKCLNCGTSAPLRFCPGCGQSTRTMRISFASLLAEIFGTVFNVDSKFIRSIKPLMLSPGLLTRCFIDGKRASFVSPVRLYLTCSLIFFVSVSLVTKDKADASSNQTVTVEPQGNGNFRLKFDDDNVSPRMSFKTNKSETEEEKAPAEAAKEDDEPTDFLDSFAERMAEKGRSLQGKSTAEVQQQFFPKLFSAASKGLILMMPLFALFLKALYVRRDPYYIDHLIFAVHFHCFLFVLFTGITWWSYLSKDNLSIPISISFFILSPLYLYKSLHRVYGQNRVKTLTKFAILSMIYLFSMSILSGLIMVVAFYTM